MQKARQLTLFECQRSQPRQPVNSCDNDSSESNPESDDDTEQPVKKKACKATKQPSSVHCDYAFGAGCRANTITVQSSTGPTTVIINPEATESPTESTIHPECSSSGAFSGPPTDIAVGPGASPVQPRNIEFPSTDFSGKLRSFNSSWYSDYSWLEYSVSRDAAYCYPCRIFTTGTGKAEKTFTVNGFRGWKHASGKKGVLQVHDKCAIHRGAMLAWEESKRNASHGTSIAHRLETSRLQQIQSNRHYLSSIVQALLFCAHQEIALRGHDESENSANRGNFLELLHLLAKHDSVVMERLRGGPRNATYTSPEVQNLLLNM